MVGGGNQVGGNDDNEGVSCEQWLEAVSAMADGEEPGVDPDLVAAHLGRCTPCEAAYQQMTALRRTARVQPAESMPDLSGRVVKAVALDDRAGRWVAVRVLLAAAAVYVVALSFRDLVLAQGHGAELHASRHLGAFSLAYGIALVVVVARPARARTVLPVGGTLGAALLITAVVDVADGHVPLSSEAMHLPELASVVLLWLLAVPALRGRPWAPVTGEGAVGGVPGLRVVEAESVDRSASTG